MHKNDEAGAGLVTLSAAEAREALCTLARLDAEAAAAYRTAIARTPDPDVRTLLEAFEADHLRHLERLNGLITAQGGQAVLPATEGLLGRLAALAGTIGAEASILSLLANEELTNASYDIAMAMAADEETRSVLERNYADEQRHLDWARDTAQQLFEDDEPGEGEPIEVVVLPSSD